MGVVEAARLLPHMILERSQEVPLSLLLLVVVTTILCACTLLYLAIFIAAPYPRGALASEKAYVTNNADGTASKPARLPCWSDRYSAEQTIARRKSASLQKVTIEPAEIGISLVVPAYNEEDRLSLMLKDAAEYLEQKPFLEASQANGVGTKQSKPKGGKKANGKAKGNSEALNTSPLLPGWEILVVSDGSTDKTISTALGFAHSHGLPSDIIRIVDLKENRGKGGAVTHGMRHVRGQYVVFADADGASRFSDLGMLVAQCQKAEDAKGRGLAVGSRAHLVGSEAVVKRSFLRNFLMHSFHLLLRLLTPPATAAIKDTQCGFKLFSRASLPDIIPFMHSEGWIFDVEMLMLAESANIPVAEVPVGWQEVKGSKLNVVWDSLGMAWGLALLRAAWGLGIYSRW
ncbi:MAG: dolichyl-phosphate beta-glucosyltransferase [Vezdaea aestivalis]|nr:MAG: dolichyl-phosphate beta-glucosyltransferase [Vezdaea aestivalis]